MLRRMLIYSPSPTLSRPPSVEILATVSSTFSEMIFGKAAAMATWFFDDFAALEAVVKFGYRLDYRRLFVNDLTFGRVCGELEERDC